MLGSHCLPNHDSGIRQRKKGDEDMESTGRRLMFHGMVLFLLGLGTGFAEQHFANVRMGLAAHLEGLMNGIFLMALGAIWHEVRLPSPVASVVFRITLYGTYGNWLLTTLAAVFGTAALSPITGAGHSGLPWQEMPATIGPARAPPSPAIKHVARSRARPAE